MDGLLQPAQLLAAGRRRSAQSGARPWSPAQRVAVEVPQRDPTGNDQSVRDAADSVIPTAPGTSLVPVPTAIHPTVNLCCSGWFSPCVRDLYFMNQIVAKRQQPSSLSQQLSALQKSVNTFASHPVAAQDDWIGTGVRLAMRAGDAAVLRRLAHAAGNSAGGSGGSVGSGGGAGSQQQAGGVAAAAAMTTPRSQLNVVVVDTAGNVTTLEDVEQQSRLDTVGTTVPCTQDSIL